MSRKPYLLAAIALLFLAQGCGGTTSKQFSGEYRVLKQYTATALPGVTIGKSVITYEPVMDFPPGTVDIYKLCIKDVARLNGVDESS